MVYLNSFNLNKLTLNLTITKSLYGSISILFLIHYMSS